MNSSRVVQISDLHLLADKSECLSGVNPHRSLSKVIDDIRALSPPPELVIASGDLTDNGCTDAYRHLKELFAKLDCPVYALAGNHDDPEVMRSELKADNIFHLRQHECQDWKLVFVNSKHESASHGYASAEELHWLQKTLDQSGDAPVLLAMHHTPLRLCASSSCQFENADELLALLANYTNVKGLIAGHTHNDVEQTRQQLRIMTTPSTMVQVTHNQLEGRKKDDEFWDFHQADGSRHGYRVLDLLDMGEISSEVRWVEAD